MLLSRCLNGIVCQRLIPSVINKRIPCLEILRRNPGVQEAIARNNPHLLTGHMEASLQEGMHTFDQYLMRLLAAGYVSADTAKHYAVNWNKLEMETHGFAPTMPGILKPDPEV